ncbi:MAG: thermonuclease family protein [Mariprofundaceae bacterium]|nr:thermonuclease family protein [Mariprofundaceae bacterium]
MMRAVSLLLGLLLLLPMAAQSGTLSVVESGQWVQVGKVYDGDTFQTRKGMKVRLLGMNTPEVRHGTERGQVMGREGTAALKRLISGQTVRLTFDRERTDRYGRTLAQVWLRDGRWVNGLLVAQGFAHVYTFAPNVRWADKLLHEEHKAIAEGLGIWKTARFSVLPAERVKARNIGEFRVVEGVVDAMRGKKGWSFTLGRLHISVPRKYRAGFKQAPALGHVGANIRVRGRIRAASRGDKLYLALHTPADMEWL